MGGTLSARNLRPLLALCLVEVPIDTTSWVIVGVIAGLLIIALLADFLLTETDFVLAAHNANCADRHLKAPVHFGHQQAGPGQDPLPL